MADATRSVVIRLALQQDESKIKVPGQTGGGGGPSGGDPKAQADAQKKAVAELAELRRQKSKEAEKLAQDRAKAEIEAEERSNRVIQDALNATARERLKEIKVAESLAAKRREMAVEAGNAARNQEDANRRAIAATREMGDAAFMAVRGFVMIGAANEQDAQKILKNLLLVQGLVDIYKGLSGVLIKVAEAYRAISTAAGAAAIAQRASAASGAGGAAAGAAGGLLGGLVAGGLAGAGAVALPIAAGAAVGFGAYQYITGQKQQEINAQQARREIAHDTSDFFTRRATAKYTNEATAITERHRSIVGLDANWRGQWNSEFAAQFGEASADVGRARTNAERAAASRTQFRAGQAQEAEFARQGQIEATQRIGAARRRRQGAVDKLGELERSPHRDGAAYQEARLAAQTQQREAERDIAASLERQQQKLTQQLQQRRAMVQLAKDQLQAEKDRVSGVNRGLGSLTKGEQDRVRRLARKVNEGGEQSLTEGELRFLEQRGGGAFGEFTGKARERRGREAFAGDDVSVLTGGKDRTRELQGQLEEAIKGEQEGSTKVVELLKQIEANRKEQVAVLEQIAESGKGIAETMEALRSIREWAELMASNEAKRAAGGLK